MDGKVREFVSLSQLFLALYLRLCLCPCPRSIETRDVICEAGFTSRGTGGTGVGRGYAQEIGRAGQQKPSESAPTTQRRRSEAVEVVVWQTQVQTEACVKQGGLGTWLGGRGDEGPASGRRQGDGRRVPRRVACEWPAREWPRPFHGFVCSTHAGESLVDLPPASYALSSSPSHGRSAPCDKEPVFFLSLVAHLRFLGDRPLFARFDSAGQTRLLFTNTCPPRRRSDSKPHAFSLPSLQSQSGCLVEKDPQASDRRLHRISRPCLDIHFTTPRCSPSIHYTSFIPSCSRSEH